MTKLTVSEYIRFRVGTYYDTEIVDVWGGNANSTEFQAVIDAVIVVKNLGYMLQALNGWTIAAQHCGIPDNRNWSDAANTYDRFADNYNS